MTTTTKRYENGNFYEAEIEGAQKFIEASRRYTFGLCELSLLEAVQCHKYTMRSFAVNGKPIYLPEDYEHGIAVFNAYKDMFVSAVIAGWSARDDWGEEEIRRFFDVEDGCFINEDYACYPQMRDMALAGFAKAIEAYKKMNDDAASKLDEANFDLVVDTVESGVLAEYALAL